MKIFTLLLIILVQLIFMPKVEAATSPNLGQTASFTILSSTYTNTAGGTTINGDLGYTTGPATVPTVNGTTHAADTAYNQAGIDQGSVLSSLASQPCTFTFAPGAIDLATDTTHGPIGVYTPGVYCTASSSAASIGAGGITLSGSGTYIFRIDGALTTTANSIVILEGASPCDVFWTPTSATTLGANSTFIGTDIDAAGITIGSTVIWTGKALAFGGTVSTTTDTITSPTCSAPTPTPSATSAAASSSTDGSSSTSGSSVAVCPALSSSIIPPAISEARRISSTSIFISWGPFSGADTFNVQYGFTNGNWLFNTNVNGFSTTINNLPPNQPIWVRVAARNSCQIGTYGTPVLVGGNAITNTPGFPNTGSPLLPNTGIAPEENYSVWGVAIISLLATFIYLTQKLSKYFKT